MEKATLTFKPVSLPRGENSHEKLPKEYFELSEPYSCIKKYGE